MRGVMSAKSMIFFAIIMAALAWLVFFGPDGCDFLGSIRHRELSAEMLPWIKDNLDAAWLNDNPDPQSIVVENVKILKSSATSEKNIENAQVSIKGYYLTPQSEQRVKFKIQKQIIVEQNGNTNTFRLSD